MRFEADTKMEKTSNYKRTHLNASEKKALSRDRLKKKKLLIRLIKEEKLTERDYETFYRIEEQRSSFEHFEMNGWMNVFGWTFVSIMHYFTSQMLNCYLIHIKISFKFLCGKLLFFSDVHYNWIACWKNCSQWK